MPTKSNALALAVLAALCCQHTHAAECNGAATPGPRNLLPIDSAAPAFVRSVPNGKLYRVGQGDDTKGNIPPPPPHTVRGGHLTDCV